MSDGEIKYEVTLVEHDAEEDRGTIPSEDDLRRVLIDGLARYDFDFLGVEITRRR